MSVIARVSAICPLCSKFIAKSRSRIERLPHPLVPRGDGRRSYDDGGWYLASGGFIQWPDKPRAWAHEACVDRYMRELAAQRESERARAQRERCGF